MSKVLTVVSFVSETTVHVYLALRVLCNFDIDKSTGRKSHFRIAFPIYKVFLIHYVKYKIEEYIYNKNNLNSFVKRT